MQVPVLCGLINVKGKNKLLEDNIEEYDQVLGIKMIFLNGEQRSTKKNKEFCTTAKLQTYC